MNKVAVEVPNAILFIVDPANNNTIIPEYLPGQVAVATDTCVSVATQTPEDGETEIYLGFDFDNPLNYPRVFSGSIYVQGGKIAVVTAKLDHLVEVNVSNGRVAFSIFVDNVDFPSVVIIKLINNDT